MENLKKAIVAEISARYTYKPPCKEDKAAGLDKNLYLCGRAADRPYKGTKLQQKEKMAYYLAKGRAVAIARELAKIAAAEAAPDTLNNTIIIKIDWTRSRTWGATAKAADNFGNVSDVASGCGYDKASTALAGVLNQHLSILKRMYAAKDKAIAAGRKPGEPHGNTDVLGYGAGYGVLPYFEGGVGISSHVEVLKRLGYVVTWGNDVVVIAEATK